MHQPRIWKLGAALPALVLACSAGEPAAPAPGALAEAGTPPAAEATSLDQPTAATETTASEPAAPANQPPELLDLEVDSSAEARGDRDLVARPRADDPDGDAVTFEYRWSVNGRHVPDADSILSHALFARGDHVALSVRAADGDDSSEWRREDPIEIGNSAPRITSTPGDFDPDGTFRYPIVVDDTDGDRGYRYEMRQGPPGMRIDSVTGTLHWTPKSDQGGVHPVTIAVNDRHGGVAVQDFDVRVAFENVEPPAALQR